jgi:hypothetical protein
MLIVGEIHYRPGSEEEVWRRVKQACHQLRINDMDPIIKRALDYVTGDLGTPFECWADVVYDRQLRQDAQIGPDPWGALPRDLGLLICRLAVRTARDRARLSMVCRDWRDTSQAIGVVDQLWYGLNAPERLDKFLTPMELGRIGHGEFQEGPCERMAAKAIEFLRTGYLDGSSLKGIRTMLGVVYTANGSVMITFSGTLNPKKPKGRAKRAALAAINKKLFKGRAEIVFAGAAGTIINKTTLLGESVLDYTGQPLERNFVAVGALASGEVTDTIPGTCALPKLIMRCQSLGLVPRWASEKLFDLSDKPIEIEFAPGALVPFWLGHSVPSCGNCRVLVPLMLRGIVGYTAKKELREAAQQAHRAAWEQYQQHLEAERRTEGEARLLVARKGFATALFELGDNAAIIDVGQAFAVEGVADRVQYLQGHGSFSSSADLGKNLAETFLDNYDRLMFENFFAIWKKVIYVPPKKSPPGDAEQRKMFSDSYPNLGCLLELWGEKAYEAEIDPDVSRQVVIQAMIATVDGKREKRNR